jgi:hypothetical protein
VRQNVLFAREGGKTWFPLVLAMVVVMIVVMIVVVVMVMVVVVAVAVVVAGWSCGRRWGWSDG